MIKRLLNLSLGLLAFTAFLPSCSTDVDVAGNYKETTVIYGLLNQYDTVQYVRIQKAFLVNDNVLDYTKVPDSIYYKPEDLSVVLEKLNPASNTIEQTINMSHTLMPKDSGMFASGNLIIYKTNAALDSSKLYRLKITNLKSGKVTTASTRLVSGLQIKNPNAFTTVTVNLNPISKNGFDLKWKPALNGVLYQVEVKFTWTEIDVVQSTSKPDSILWTFSPIERKTTADITYNLPHNEFFIFLRDNLEAKPNVQRKIGKISFKIYAGTEELNQYIQINKPSTGIIQEKPLYTNVENGLGIFSARASFERNNLDLTKSPTRDTLRLGQYTGHLGFIE